MSTSNNNKNTVTDASIEGGYLAIEGARELMSANIDKIAFKAKANGKPWGVKDDNSKENKPLTSKMRAFANHVIAGDSTQTAYRKAYNADSCSDASVNSGSNKLMHDVRVSKLIGSYLEANVINILADQQATRRHILQELLKHSQDEKAQLNNRLRSLELMGKAIGMFSDKVDTVPQAIDVTVLKKELESSLSLLKDV